MVYRLKGDKMTQNRPDLPAPLMRAVRQRCGFGCVICGMPIVEYDHLLGWAKVRRHVAAEIALLCDNHHRAKTSGFLPNARVVAANANPLNLQTGVTKPYGLEYSGNEFKMSIGSCSFDGSGNVSDVTAEAIRIDRQPLLWVRYEDNHILLNLHVYNSRGELILQIADNELVLNVHSWDIEIVGTRLVIREASRNVLFDVLFSPPAGVHVRRGRFLYNGVEVLVNSRWVAILNNRKLFADIRIGNVRAGVVTAGFNIIGPEGDPAMSGVAVLDVPRDGWDREAAIRWVKKEAGKTAAQIEAIHGLLDAKSLD